MDSVEIESLVPISTQTLASFFQKEEPARNDIAKARIAASLLGTVIRARQTENARERTYFSMARQLTDDPATLTAYVKAAMPMSSFVKALPAGS